jgi:hypothetical protein
MRACDGANQRLREDFVLGLWIEAEYAPRGDAVRSARAAFEDRR